MKKQLFILSNIYEESQSIGITKKVHQQIDAFRRLGYDNITYTGYLKEGVAIFDNDGSIIKFKKYLFKKPFLIEVTKNYTLKILCAEFMKQSISFDLIYARYIFFDWFFLKFLKNASKKSQNIVVEAHCYPIYEKGNYSLYPIYCIDKLYISRSKKYINLVAGITDIKNIWGIPTVNIDNGITLSDYRLQNLVNKSTLDLIFIGYEYRVHGVDRLLKGMFEYYKENKNTKVIKLHLVGRFLDSTYQLVDELSLGKYVIFEGIKFGEKLNDIFDHCEIGIGVLAPHRKNSNIGTGLKSKEYIARGLPQVYAGESITLPKEWPYAYTVASCEDYLNISDLISFYENLINDDRNYAIHMREFAENLTWDNEIKKILEKINQR